MPKKMHLVAGIVATLTIAIFFRRFRKSGG